MTRRAKIVTAASAVVVALGLGTGIAVATNSGDGDEPPISGSALERASAEALDATGGGRVTETEVGDEEAYYEVEITLADGTQVDVHLDRDFTVVGQERDGEDDDQAGEGSER